MARKSFVERDQQRNDLVGFTLDDRPLAPATTDKGEIYYDTVAQRAKLNIGDGTTPDWRNILLTGDTLAKYTSDFLVGTWAGAGPYTLTIAAATHGLGATKALTVAVYEDGTPNSLVDTEVTVADNGDVVITSTTTFAGHYVIMG